MCNTSPAHSQAYLLSFYCFVCKKTKKPTLIGWMVCQSTLRMCCRRFQVRCDIGSAAMLELMVTSHVCTLRSQGLTTVVLEVCGRSKMMGWELPSKAEGIQWDPSNTDTLGPLKCVLIRGVSSFQGANKSDISYLKTSRAFDVLIHSGKPNAVG